MPLDIFSFLTTIKTTLFHGQMGHFGGFFSVPPHILLKLDETDAALEHGIQVLGPWPLRVGSIINSVSRFEVRAVFLTTRYIC